MTWEPGTTATPTATPTVASVVGWTSVQSDDPLAGLLLYGDKNPATRDMAGLPAAVAVSQDHLLPHFASSSRWYTGVGVANPNAGQANVTLTAYSDAGALLGSADRTVPAHGKISEVVSGLYGGTVTGTGWIKVHSDLQVQVFDLYGDMLAGGIAALPSAQQGTSIILSHFVHSSRWWTGITILNPGSTEVSVTLKGYQSDGVLLEEQTFPVAASSKLAGFVESLMPLLANHTGWIQVDATGPVVGLVVYGDKSAVPNRIAAIPAVPASQYIYLSNFFQDADWWTGIALVNPSATTTATMAVTALTPDGHVIDSKFIDLPPLNKSLGFVSSLMNLGSNTQGWVYIHALEPVVGLEILNADDAAEQAYGLAGIEAQGDALALGLPHHVTSSRWWTLFALASTGNNDAHVTINAYDNAGNVVDTDSRTIPARGRIAEYVKDLFGW